ncbi:hypothetical protein STENM36S_04955 [Streptomyces tendae]
MSENAVQRLLKKDHRTARAAAGESISLSDDCAKALLGELASGEVVMALYHDGWGYAALTTRGLVLVRNLLAPKAARVPTPLLILRRAYGMFGSVDVLVDGKPHKLHGSKLDPKGELLGTVGRLLPTDSPLRPACGRRLSAWLRRHPVSVAAAAAVVAFAGLNRARAGRRPWRRTGRTAPWICPTSTARPSPRRWRRPASTGGGRSRPPTPPPPAGR